MRRWLALLIGTATIALAGTALALTGSSGDANGDVAVETTVATEHTITTEREAEEPPEIETVPKWETEDEVSTEEVDEEDGVEEPVEEEPKEEEPADTTAPEIEILYPENGQVFERKEVVFEGEVEPGAHVYAGRYEADVSESGGWRIVLILGDGDNFVTIKAVDEAGNVGSDTVTVIYEAPEPTHEEEPDEEEPKEEEPAVEEPVEWEFSAHQVYGECDDNPPYDVFHGTGKPGSAIHIESEYGGGTAEINQEGDWEIKVTFESAPVGEEFPVHVSDEFGHHKVFEFAHIAAD